MVLGSEGSSLSKLLEGLLMQQGSCTHCPWHCMPWNTFSLHFFVDHFCFITSPIYKHPCCFFPSHGPREGFFWAKTDSFLGVCCRGAPDFGFLTLARCQVPFLLFGLPCTFRKYCKRKARLSFFTEQRTVEASRDPLSLSARTAPLPESRIHRRSRRATVTGDPGATRRPQLLLQVDCLQAWDTPSKGW